MGFVRRARLSCNRVQQQGVDCEREHGGRKVPYKYNVVEPRTVDRTQLGLTGVWGWIVCVARPVPDVGRDS